MTRYVVGGFPDGCRMATISKMGLIRHRGENQFYLSQGLGGHAVGLQRVGDIVRV